MNDTLSHEFVVYDIFTNRGYDVELTFKICEELPISLLDIDLILSRYYVRRRLGYRKSAGYGFVLDTDGATILDGNFINDIKDFASQQQWTHFLNLTDQTVYKIELKIL